MVAWLKNIKFGSLGLIISCLFLISCDSSLIPPETRTQAVLNQVKQKAWTTFSIETNPFTLRAFGSSLIKKSKILIIYIEGDGLAWLTENSPSNNPTPRVPTGLNLAFQDPDAGQIAYLARPCQYVLGFCAQSPPMFPEIKKWTFYIKSFLIRVLIVNAEIMSSNSINVFCKLNNSLIDFLRIFHVGTF